LNALYGSTTEAGAVQRIFTVAASLDGFGMALLRLGLVIVLVWIGGLKFARYEAEGIVPLVANSPLMSFFYHHPAPKDRHHMNKEGELNPANREWHQTSGTYPVPYGLGIVIVSIGILIALHPLKVAQPSSALKPGIRMVVCAARRLGKRRDEGIHLLKNIFLIIRSKYVVARMRLHRDYESRKT
jgi:uncharacterized membrane protein YkgB